MINKILIIIFTGFFGLLISNCANNDQITNKNRICNLLKLPETLDISKANYSVYRSSMDLVCPEIIYIKFEASQEVLSKVIKDFNLTSYSRKDFANLPPVDELWSLHKDSNRDFENKLVWWRPSSSKDYLYSGTYKFYKFALSRITLNFDKGIFYIIIECPAI